MDFLWIVVLQTIGTIAIIAEVMVPSMGLLTISAIAAFGGSYYFAASVDPIAVPVLLIINLISVPATLLLAVKGLSKTKLSLQKELDQKGPRVSEYEVGTEGEAFTDLHPAGKITIDGKLVDVLSTGDYIVKGDLVKIKSVDNTGIRVIKL